MPSKLNLDIFRNVMVKNSLMVLVFVISYLALTGTFKPTLESYADALPTDIDKVIGFSGDAHDNPGLTNQTAESCRQLALKNPKYVAWGYRVPETVDPAWRNTCFLYTQLRPFAGNPDDKQHMTGCLRSGEKVALGCKVPVSSLPNDIDKVSGWQGAHDNNELKNQTAESCRQAALKDPKYVAWGYRTNEHPDPNWKDTCFLYTDGFQPFAGNQGDTAHITGCLRPGEKVSLGCKAPVSTTPTTATANVAPAPAPTTQVVNTPPTTSTTTATTPSSCDTTACNRIINDYIAKKWAYTSSDFGECKGCPVVRYPNTLPTTSATVSTASTASTASVAPTPTTAATAPAPAPTTCDTTACNRIINDYIAKKWAYTSSDFGECKGCPVVRYPNTLPTTSATASTAPTPSAASSEDIISKHLQILKFAWFIFLNVAEKTASDIQLPLMSKARIIWLAALKVVGFPVGLYDDLGLRLYNLTDKSELTFSTMVIPKDVVTAMYNAYIKQNGSFTPSNKQAYDEAEVISRDITQVANIKADPHPFFNQPPRTIAPSTPVPTTTVIPPVAAPQVTAPAPQTTPSVVPTSTTPPAQVPSAVQTPALAPKEGVVVTTPTFKLYDPSATQSVPTQVFDKPATPTTPSAPSAAIIPVTVDAQKEYTFDIPKMEAINEWVKKTIANKTLWMVIAIFMVWIVVIGLIVSIVRSRATMMPTTNYTM
jgi:hypothetical protein